MVVVAAVAVVVLSLILSDLNGFSWVEIRPFRRRRQTKKAAAEVAKRTAATTAATTSLVDALLGLGDSGTTREEMFAGNEAKLAGVVGLAVAGGGGGGECSVGKKEPGSGVEPENGVWGGDGGGEGGVESNGKNGWWRIRRLSAAVWWWVPPYDNTTNKHKKPVAAVGIVGSKNQQW